MAGVKLGNANTKINTGGKDRIKFDDLVEFPKFTGNEFNSFRPVGELFAYGTHWLEITYVDKKAEQTKKTNVGRTCINVKSDGTIDPKGGCAYCKVGHVPRTSYLQNMIDIAEEENAPRNAANPTPEEKRSGFKTKGSKLWTPVVVLMFPPTVAEVMMQLTKKNKDKEGKIRELSDPSFGRALDISKDTRAGVSPGNIWQVQKCDNLMRKLTPVQRAYYMWDIAGTIKAMMVTPKQSESDLKQNILQLTDKEIENLDLSEYPDLIAKRNKSSGKKKSKSGSFTVDDDDDDDDLPIKSKRRREIDDDDDDDDLPIKSKRRREIDDDDDDDDDDAPVSRKKKKSSKRKTFSVDSLL